MKRDQEAHSIESNLIQPKLSLHEIDKYSVVIEHLGFNWIVEQFRERVSWINGGEKLST